ncbi:major facilitator superfamily domain-containing protein [Vararia minispora EC-137]|uniref:Major facilitator superfamily domain-containing protein n=1 Tax=Vararia minispora EC-137 TaxID=1314806 RepID=A0ACB8QWY8_9AGAM|nr:major facilitator superfamily domain-containing protein [Vararia minispora EC-137]
MSVVYTHDRVYVRPSSVKLDVNLVTWDGPDDPENPQNWSHRYRWLVTLICALMTINVTFASSAPATATTLIALRFRVGQEVADLVTSLFLLGYCFGPIFWGPGSETFGRRPIFCLTMVSYTVLIMGQALAPNIQTLLTTRFFSGFFACAPLTNGAGVLADVWDPVVRGPAASLFATMVFLGPAIGPIVSGFVVEDTLDFRWVFWVMMAFAGVCSAIAVLFFPETRAEKILSSKAKRLRKEDPVRNKDRYAELERQGWNFGPLLDRTVKRPFKMLTVEPILVLITIYLSVVYGVLYGLLEAIPYIFSKHNFTISQSGLIFVGIGIGTIIGGIIFAFSSRMYPRLVEEWHGFPPPEHRLYGAMIAGPALVVGAFWLGWTGNSPAIPWYVPALSTIPVGMSIALIFVSFTAYMVDTYLMYAASAVSANTAVRSAVGAAFPLFTRQMFVGLGVGWACTLVGIIAVLLAPIPFLFYRYGSRIRGRSRFAPCADLKIAEKKRLAAQGGEMDV